MYFWTNTPDQSKFVSFCADVNRLNAYINDPNVSEEQSQTYQIQFIAAKAKMSLQFLIVNSDWEEWLYANNLGTPDLSGDGTIRVPDFLESSIAVILEPPEGTYVYQGEQFYWNDFLRMLALKAFLLRAEPGSKSEEYNPEGYFNESDVETS